MTSVVGSPAAGAHRQGLASTGYLAHFDSVRLEDAGHPIPVAMINRSLVEIASSADSKATASVLGEELNTTDAAELQETVITRLFEQYAADKGIKTEPAEIDAYLDTMRQWKAAEGLSAEDELTPAEAAEVESLEKTMAANLIRQWKINKSLYGQYGGRIIYQQLGPEPLDAFRLFLEQRKRDGAFAIHDAVLAQEFWNYFKDDSRHDFMQPGSADAMNAFTSPPWERKP